MLDSSKPATLSAGLGAFVAIATVSVFIVIGTVLCVIRYKRRARLKGANFAEVNSDAIVLYFLRSRILESFTTTASPWFV